VRKDVPSGLAAAVACALEKDMGARFTTADEMAAAIAPFADAPVAGALPLVQSHPTLKETRQATAWARVTMHAKASPLAAVLVVLVCLLLAGTGIALIVVSLRAR
jgi:hypothetical protein